MIKDTLLSIYTLMVEGVERKQEQLLQRPTYQWAWIVILGILVIAAAVAWFQCMDRGFRGFSGEIKLHTTWGIPVGIQLGCY